VTIQDQSGRGTVSAAEPQIVDGLNLMRAFVKIADAEDSVLAEGVDLHLN
jgi:hypothetical protein